MCGTVTRGIWIALLLLHFHITTHRIYSVHGQEVRYYSGTGGPVVLELAFFFELDHCSSTFLL